MVTGSEMNKYVYVTITSAQKDGRDSFKYHKGSTGLGYKALARFCECCRQNQADVVSKIRNKIHQTLLKPFSRAPQFLISPSFDFLARFPLNNLPRGPVPRKLVNFTHGLPAQSLARYTNRARPPQVGLGIFKMATFFISLF